MPFWNELFLEWLWFNRRRDCWHRSISLSLAAAGIQRNLLCRNLKELQQVTASFRRSVSLWLRPPLRCDLLESLFGRRGGLQFGEPVLFLFARRRGAAVERRGALYDVVRQVRRRWQHFYATTCTYFINKVLVVLKMKRLIRLTTTSIVASEPQNGKMLENRALVWNQNNSKLTTVESR